MAQAMETLAAEQDGYVSFEAVRDPHTGRGIAVSCWRDEQAARAWKAVAEHQLAQRLGQQRWYADYEVIVAEVLRSYCAADQ